MAWRQNDVIVLNVAADAYTCIVGGAEILSPVRDAPDEVAAHPAFHAELIAAGLITRDRPETRRRHVSLPMRVLQPEPVSPFGTALWTALLILAAGRQFDASTLEALIRPESRRRGPCRPTPSKIAATAAAFHTALPWAPSPGQCLKRTFTLRRLLAREGIVTDWVFGVRTWPFLAHCWLQIDDVLLADDLDRVRGFSPILTV
ncbi:hypothetical protein D3C73_1203480 [compost metagenome]